MRFTALLWVLGCTSIASLVQAQVSSDTLAYSNDLPEVVVTARRASQPASEVVGTLARRSAAAIRTAARRTSPEALVGLPGVWLQKTYHGGGAAFLRGLTGNQTLLLLDGIRLNNSTFRSGPNQYFNTIDVFSIDRLEVWHSAGSVLYGSDAIGGTINVLTNTPAWSDSGLVARSRAYGRWRSSDQEWTGRAELTLATAHQAVSGGFTFRDFGDLIAGGDLGKEAPSSYSERATDLKGVFKIGRYGLLTLAYNWVRQEDIGHFDQVAQRGFSLWKFDPQIRQLVYLRYQQVHPSDWLERSRWTIAWQRSEEGRINQREGSNLLNRATDRVRTLSASGELFTRFAPGLRGIVGIEFYGDRIESSNQSLNLDNSQLTFGRGLYPDDSEALNAAAYLQQYLKFGSWTVESGLRFNAIRLQFEDAEFGDVDVSPSALVGSAGIGYRVDSSRQLFLRAEMGFRAPNVNDLSSFGPFDFGVETPVSDLDPERSLNLNFGFRVRQGVYRMEVAGFYTRLFDLINRVPGVFRGDTLFQGDRVFQKANTARAYLLGGEVAAEWRPVARFVVRTNLSYTYGVDSERNEPLRRVPPFNGLFQVRYATQLFSITGESLFAAAQRRLNAQDISDHRIADGGTDGWLIVNIRSGLIRSRWRIEAGLDNIFDVAYRMHGSGVDGVGRHLWVGIGYGM